MKSCLLIAFLSRKLSNARSFSSAIVREAEKYKLLLPVGFFGGMVFVLDLTSSYAFLALGSLDFETASLTSLLAPVPLTNLLFDI